MMDDNPANILNINYASQFALRVALQTMKERCMSQQKRLTTIEEENQHLRERLAQDNKQNNKTTITHSTGGVVENFQLRMQVSELQRQNEQLTAHINMVSAENRKLWSRLSQMTKEKSNDTTQNANDTLGINGDISRMSSNQNLIRSKTFTQHSPNPKLRHKLIAADSTESDAVDNSLDTALSEVLESAVQIGFSFLNTCTLSKEDTEEQDFNVEAKKCIEGLQDMRREAMKQQKELNNAYASLKAKLASNSCGECAKTLKKPEMADKSLETDESLNEYQQQNNKIEYIEQLSSSGTTKDLDHTIAASKPMTATTMATAASNQLNIIQEKILADKADKMCPMCGRIYDSRVSFNAFCEHVEEHFFDDSSDSEHNFEIVSHTVGNF